MEWIQGDFQWKKNNGFFTLSETNSSHLKMGWSIFRGELLVSGSVGVFEGMILPSYMGNLMQVSMFCKGQQKLEVCL